MKADTIEEIAAIKGKTYTTIPDARAVTNPLWRAHMFKKIDGQMQMGLHNAAECEHLNKDGWTMSPLDFMDDFEAEEGSTEVEQAVESMTHILNTIANVDHIHDKDSLVKLLDDFFGVKVNPKAKLPVIRGTIRKEAKKQGCWIEPAKEETKKPEKD